MPAIMQLSLSILALLIASATVNADSAFLKLMNPSAEPMPAEKTLDLLNVLDEAYSSGLEKPAYEDGDWPEIVKSYIQLAKVNVNKCNLKEAKTWTVPVEFDMKPFSSHLVAFAKHYGDLQNQVCENEFRRLVETLSGEERDKSSAITNTVIRALQTQAGPKSDSKGAQLVPPEVLKKLEKVPSETLAWAVLSYIKQNSGPFSLRWENNDHDWFAGKYDKKIFEVCLPVKLKLANIVEFYEPRLSASYVVGHFNQFTWAWVSKTRVCKHLVDRRDEVIAKAFALYKKIATI